jgi:hypothetical protein
MTTTQKGTTPVQLPDGAVETHYDDTEAPLATTKRSLTNCWKRPAATRTSTPS